MIKRKITSITIQHNYNATIAMTREIILKMPAVKMIIIIVTMIMIRTTIITAAIKKSHNVITEI